MIVVDASVLVDVLLNAPGAEAIRARLGGSPEVLNAPHLVDLEVAQVIRRYDRIGELDPLQARVAFANLSALPMERHPHRALLPRIWQLRNNLTAYDAAYVALAEMLDATLLTRDRRLAAAPGVRARVEVI